MRTDGGPNYIEHVINRSPAEHAFDSWIGQVESLLAGKASVAAERAWFAFEDGISADDYALALQAQAGGA